MADYGSHHRDDRNASQGDGYDIESILYHSQTLSREFNDTIETTLSEAELRLAEAGYPKFQSMQRTVHNHVKEWRGLTKALQEMALQFRNSCNRLLVGKQTLDGKINVQRVSAFAPPPTPPQAK